MAGDLPAGVIQITQGSGGPPRPAQNTRIPPPPPNHGHPPAPPRGPPVGQQVQQRDVHHPSQMHQQVPIAPPEHLIPPQFRHRPSVEISNIRREHLSPADVREQLADYIIYRFEKRYDVNELDEEGYPIRPSWEDVTRTEVRDMSKQEATRQVRLLERTTKTVSEKKKELGPAQQRQLEKAQQDLAGRDPDPRFQYVLVQIDHQLKKLDDHYYYTSQYTDHSRSKTKKVTVAKRSLSATRDRKHKTKYVRVSLTAFFKRVLCPEQDPFAVLREMEQRELERRAERDRIHHIRMLQAQAAMQQQLPVPKQIAAPQKPPAANKQPPQVIQIVKKKGGKIYHNQHSPKSSRSSCSYYSDSGSGTELTPESSISSSSWGRRRRSRSRHRHGDRPEQYGIESAPRRHHKREQHYILDSYPPRVPAVPPAPPSPVALPSPFEIEILKEEMYQAGRADERAVARLLEPRVAEEVVYRPQHALPPRVIQRRPSIRLVNPNEVARRRHDDDLDRFERLRLEDDFQYEQDRRRQEEFEAEMRDEEFRRRRDMEGRLRPQPFDEGAFGVEESDLWDERGRRPLIHHAEGAPRFDPHNPFAPLGRGGRNSFR